MLSVALLFTAYLLPRTAPPALQVRAHASSRSTSVRALDGGEAVTDALVSALGNVADRRGEIVVVKYGGHAMTDAAAAASFAADMAMLQSLGLRPVVVHGGGPQIGAMLKRLEIPSNFIDGLRVTDEATMEVVEMVLCGSLNKKIAAAINCAGGRAVGLSGKDDFLVRASRKAHSMVDESGSTVEVDLGLVGAPESVRTELLHGLLEQGIVPVLAPVAAGAAGESFNVNADTMAGVVAGALGAESLLLLTDVEGVLDGPPPEGTLIQKLTAAEAQGLCDDGTASGGMIPKLGTAMDAVAGGVGSAVIMDGRVAHGALLYLFGSTPVGTAVVA